MKRATVYRRRSSVLVHPSSCTAEGVWILSEPCVRLPAGCTDADIGHAVLTALQQSKTTVPQPAQWSGVLQPLLRAAGVTTWTSFAKGAVCVEVEQDGGRLALIPTVNQGSKGGFQSDNAGQRLIAVPERHEIVGAAVRELLSRRAELEQTGTGLRLESRSAGRRIRDPLRDARIPRSPGNAR
jgi:hypothetical protein